MERQNLMEIKDEEKTNLSLEERVADMKGELAKSQLIARELIIDINDAHIPYTEKERLDTKARIVSDYINETIKRMEELVQLTPQE